MKFAPLLGLLVILLGGSRGQSFAAQATDGALSPVRLLAGFEDGKTAPFVGSAADNLLTTGATSIGSSAQDDPHLQLAMALKIANVNLHEATALNALQAGGGAWGFYNGGNRWTFGAYMYKCAQEYGMKFRLSWYWNASAGDSCYALDCREDDYAWVVTNARRDLIPTLPTA